MIVVLLCGRFESIPHAISASLLEEHAHEVEIDVGDLSPKGDNLSSILHSHYIETILLNGSKFESIVSEFTYNQLYCVYFFFCCFSERFQCLFYYFSLSWVMMTLSQQFSFLLLISR